MANVAHLIIAHQSPKQVGRLIGTLSHPLHDVYVQVDKKQDIEPFCLALRETGAHLIANRKRIDWGAYNTVDATLSAMSEILGYKHYDFINLLSGSDYSLVKPTTVDDFLNIHSQKSFMEFHRRGSPWWENARTRTEKLHLTNYRFKGKHLLQSLVNKFPFKRTPPLGLELVGSSQWFTMATAHVAYVLGYLEKHPSVIRFFKHTWGADEFFFQTILLNSHLRNEIVNDNLRYIDWDDGMASPRTLTSDDYPSLISSKKIYARKFDAAVDSSVLSMLDAHRNATL